jgi:RAB6A-GEF complex partner protein 2
MLEAHESLPSDLTAPPTAEKRHTTSITTTTTTSTRRTHAEHHASFMPQTLRTTFALDIPSDATPSFRLSLGGKPSSSSEGGLAWKVRLCLLVAVAAPDAQVRGMVREGPRGHWGSTWIPTDSLAPLERERPPPAPAPAPAEKPASSPLPTSPAQTRSWASLLASAFLGVSDGEGEGGEGGEGGDEALTDEDDADEGGGEVDFGAGEEEEWREIAVETVECEVPVMVWPGNTAFRPEDVVFDV